VGVIVGVNEIDTETEGVGEGGIELDVGDGVTGGDVGDGVTGGSGG